MKNFHVELINGLTKETELQPLIKQYFNDDIIKSKPYDIYDWKGELYYYELKSRTCNYNKYPTTLITAKKIFCNHHRFIFHFNDGTYFIEYEKELFDTFEKKDFVRFERFGRKDNPQLYIYIPINKLTKINI